MSKAAGSFAQSDALPESQSPLHSRKTTTHPNEALMLSGVPRGRTTAQEMDKPRSVLAQFCFTLGPLARFTGGGQKSHGTDASSMDQILQGKVEESLCWGPCRLSIPRDTVRHLPSPRFSPAFLQLLARVREAWAQVLCGFGQAAPPHWALTSFPENLSNVRCLARCQPDMAQGMRPPDGWKGAWEPQN